MPQPAPIMIANQSIFGPRNTALPSSSNNPTSSFTTTPVQVSFTRLKLDTPQAAINAQNAFTYDWFGLPPETRNRIYQHYWGDVVVTVNGCKNKPVKITSREPLVPPPFKPRHGAFITLCYKRKSLTASKRFYNDARDELWQNMHVKFERRWDLINARMNQSLNPRSPYDFPNGAPVGRNSLAMFPFQVDLFANMEVLHINMSTFSDFTGVVSTPEGKRAALNPLARVTYFMPNLKGLAFTIDGRSKIADTDDVMLPEAWFIEILLAVTNHNRKIKNLEFRTGLGYTSGAFAKRNGRHCVWAMNAVFQNHMNAPEPANDVRMERLDCDGTSGLALRCRFGRRMLRSFNASRNALYAEAYPILFRKVERLQAPKPLVL